MDEDAAAKYVDDFLSGKMGLAPREAPAFPSLPWAAGGVNELFGARHPAPLAAALPHQ